MGDGGMHAAAFHGGGGGGRGFSGRIGGGSIGVAHFAGPRAVGIARGPAFAHRAFFPHHRVFARRSFVGYGLYAGYSCWRWVPTAFGPRRVWACDYPYSSYSSYY